MRIFMCYAEQDRVFTEDLMSVLMDREFMISRHNHRRDVSDWQNAIARSFVLVYILSKASGASEVCTQQWQYAVAHRKRIIILKLDEAAIPVELQRMNLIDYLDFEDIGRQIADGMPTLRRERYATEVSLRMLIAELAEAQHMFEEGDRRATLAQRAPIPVDLDEGQPVFNTNPEDDDDDTMPYVTPEIEEIRREESPD